MREIKFRAWDVTNSTMFFAGYNDWKSSKIETHDYLKLTLDGVVVRQMSYSNDPSDSLSDLEEEMSPGTYVLMQFTGLLDKNSKEIYEGDIVSRPERTGLGWNGSDTKFALKIIVKWENELGYNRMLKEPSIEVIGNIYENPELIQN